MTAIHTPSLEITLVHLGVRSLGPETLWAERQLDSAQHVEGNLIIFDATMMRLRSTTSNQRQKILPDVVVYFPGVGQTEIVGVLYCIPLCG